MTTQANSNWSVSGIITPISWDKNDNVRGISIFTSDDEDIIISDATYFKKLRKLINKYVTVEGRVISNGFVRKMISVTKFRIGNKLKKKLTSNKRAGEIEIGSLFAIITRS
jgi:hypothetical protein